MDTLTEEYSSSLEDLTFNSKPHINMLTILADENKKYADHIVNLIEARLSKAGAKLPILYLLDSIVKNVGENYRPLFAKNLVQTFETAFKASDDKQKMSLYKLRSTWDDHFPLKALYSLDVNIKGKDPNWPVKPLPAHLQDNMSTNIHINPKFLKKNEETSDTIKKSKSDVVKVKSRKVSSDVETIQQQLVRQQKELLDLQQKKLILELEQTKQQLQEKEKEIKLIKRDKSTSIKTSNMEPKIQENFKVTVSNVLTSTSISHSKEMISSKDPRLKSDKKVAVENISPSKNRVSEKLASTKNKNNIPTKKSLLKASDRERNAPPIKADPTQENTKYSKSGTSKIKFNAGKKASKKPPSPSENDRRKKRSYRNKVAKSPTPPPPKFLKCSAPPTHQKSISPDSTVKRLDPRSRPAEKRFPDKNMESESTSEDLNDCSVSPRFSPEPDTFNINENKKYHEQRKKGSSLVSRRVSVDPNVQIPQELTLSHKNEILEQADLQLHNGQLTHEQHKEMLKQLHHIFELQRDRKLLIHGQRHGFDNSDVGTSDYVEGFNCVTSQPMKKNSHSHKQFDRRSRQTKSIPKDQFIKSERENTSTKEFIDQEYRSTSDSGWRKNSKSPVDKKLINSKISNNVDNEKGKKNLRRFALEDAEKKNNNKSFKRKSPTFSKRIPKLPKVDREKDKLSDVKRGPEEPEDFIIANIPTKDDSTKSKERGNYVSMKKDDDDDDDNVRQTCEEPEEFIIAGMKEKEDSNEASFAYREHMKKIQRSMNSRKPNSDNKEDDSDEKKKSPDNLKSPPLPLKKRRYVSFESKQDYGDKKSDSPTDKIQNKENFEDNDSSSVVAVINDNGDVVLNDESDKQGSRGEENKPAKHQNHKKDFQGRGDWPREGREHFRGRGSHRGRFRGFSPYRKGRMRFPPRLNKDEAHMRFGRMQENVDDLPNMEREKRRPPLLRHHGPGWNSPPRDNSHFDIARGRLRPHLPTSSRRDNFFPHMSDREAGFLPKDFYMEERRSPPRPRFHDEEFFPDWDPLRHQRSPVEELPPPFMHDDFRFLNEPPRMHNPLDLPDIDLYAKLDHVNPNYHHSDLFGSQVTSQPEHPIEPEINQIDVNKLLSDLLNNGIIPGSKKPESSYPREDNESINPAIKKMDNELAETVRPISPFNPDAITLNQDADIPLLTLKSNLGERHNGIVNRLYTGIQCATCGLRFTTMQTDLYADHLDWHYRINKKDKDGFAHNHRTIYPTAGEWICYEEIENLQSRTKSAVFDSMDDEDDDIATQEISNKVGLTGTPGEEYCRVCKEGFNTIYNESEEVWQFENCIKIDDINFHPNCYEDHFQNSSIPTPIKTPLVPISFGDNSAEEDKTEDINFSYAIPGLDSLTEISKDEERVCSEFKTEIIPKLEQPDYDISTNAQEQSENVENSKENISLDAISDEERVDQEDHLKIDENEPLVATCDTPITVKEESLSCQENAVTPTTEENVLPDDPDHIVNDDL